MQIVFNIEIAIGSSPKAVAFKSATKLRATWLILDRKMKNDEEYLLKKLYCGISRIRSYDRIVRIRRPIDTPQQKRSYRSSQTYTTSISNDFSTDLEFFTIDILNNSDVNYQMYHDQGQGQDFKETNNKMQEHASLSTEVYPKSERYLYSGGARNFFLGGAKKYTVCEQFFKF
ncbi:hypothetical protein QL285_029607 [Trifolium repens]|nr:hypothetical protein QL285_029607 [Trifolium repens]